jgi:hypothetical protein
MRSAQMDGKLSNSLAGNAETSARNMQKLEIIKWAKEMLKHIRSASL